MVEYVIGTALVIVIFTAAAGALHVMTEKQATRSTKTVTTMAPCIWDGDTAKGLDGSGDKEECW